MTNIRLQQTTHLQQPLSICFQIYNSFPSSILQTHPKNNVQLLMQQFWSNLMGWELVRTKISRPGLEAHHHEARPH